MRRVYTRPKIEASRQRSFGRTTPNPLGPSGTVPVPLYSVMKERNGRRTQV